MAVITWPGFKTGSVSYGIENDVQITIMRNGKANTYGLPGARWIATINFENELEQMQRPAIEAWIISLKGGANRAQIYHLARKNPSGTLRGSPSLQSTAVAGSESIALTNCNGTLKKGDIIGLPGQAVVVMGEANPVSTNMTVFVYPSLRSTHSAGTAVVWDKPAIQFIPRSSVAGPFPYAPNGFRPAISIDLVEAW